MSCTYRIHCVSPMLSYVECQDRECTNTNKSTRHLFQMKYQQEKVIDDGLSFKCEECVSRKANKNTKYSEEIAHVSTEDLEETNTSKVLNDANDNNAKNEFSF